MLIYIQRHRSFAGKWIYNGYAHAWAYLDHSVEFIDSLDEINTTEKYKVFCCDALVNHSNFHKIENSETTYLYVQPNSFPEPWGKHPNYKCALSEDLIEKINDLSNVIQWNFGSSSKYHNLWSNVVSVPLAFDNINYIAGYCHDYDYDVCFIGAAVNNGFGEKIPIMNEILQPFVNSGLRCGFAVGQNITHEQENHVLLKSKVALNIHDLYQRKLGLDSNERTFKSLGVNGILVCDDVQHVKTLFPECFCSNSPEELINKTKEYCSLPIDELNKIKMKNINNIENNHTYIKRVEKLLSII